jgi:hypothetical protein
MVSVLGGEVKEGEQSIPILGQAGESLVVPFVGLPNGCSDAARNPEGRPAWYSLRYREALISPIYRCPMIWAKRHFPFDVDYAPYLQRLVELHGMMLDSSEFVMFACHISGRGDDDVYIGLPMGVPLASFDGFQLVADGDLPPTFDQLLHPKEGGHELRIQL